MHSILSRLFFMTLTFQCVFGLNASDGYNIGVVLGSILGGLGAVAIAGFFFYMFCIRRWVGKGEPPELGYTRQNDYNLKKQSRPLKSRHGAQGSAAPYIGGGGGVIPRDTGRRNDVYQHDDPIRHSYPSGGTRYEGGDMGGGPAVVLSTGGSDHQLRQHSPNISYSSEEMRAGRQGYDVTASRTYQQRTYATQPGGSAEGGSPISAAYLGTGV